MTSALPPLTRADRMEGKCWLVRRAWPDGTAGGSTAELVDPADPARLRAGRWSAENGWHILPFGADPRLPALAPTVVRSAAATALVGHRYGRRAVVRTLDGYAKVLRPGRATTAAARHRAAAAALGDGIDIPRLVRTDTDVLVTEPLAGACLAELGARGDPRALAGWTMVGRWLGGLSRARAGGRLPEHGGADEAAVVDTWIRRLLALGVLDPEVARRLAMVSDSVRCGLVDGDRGRRVVAHRDLHDGQLLLAGGRLGLIDLDTAAVAEPALDVGNLLAHLDLRSRQHTRPVAGTGLPDERLDPKVAAAAAAALLAAATPAVRRRAGVYRVAASLRLIGVYAWRPQWRGVALRWAGDLAGSTDPAQDWPGGGRG